MGKEDKIVHRFYGNGSVWNPTTGRLLCSFFENGNKYETTNEKEIEILKNNYEFDKVVIEVEIKEEIKRTEVIKEKKVESKKVDKEVKEEEVVVIEEVIKEDENVEEKELVKEDLYKLLEEKGIKYKKTQKLETLITLLEEGK